jgi:FAD/FMN-containing dehydrogenase
MAPVEPRYLEDASGFRGFAERLFRPGTAEEAAAIVRDAAREGTPLTVRGAGTGVTGGGVAQGGWIISTERLSALRLDKGCATAGAGVVLRDLQEAAARSGQLYPPDPTEWTASAGGTIATNASGSRSFLYGATRRWVRGLTVVMADGTIRRFRRGDAIDFEVPAIPLSGAIKNTAGYLLRPGMDWIDLFAGSEGTLGLITEAELALIPAPAALLTGAVFFADDAAAIAAVDEWRPIAGCRMLEYMDQGSLRLLASVIPETPAAGAAIICEQETGDPAADVEAWVDRVEAAGADAERSWFAVSDADRERFRRFRHALPEAVNDTVRRNGFMKLGSDYAVPRGRNLDMLRAYRDRLEAEFAGRYVIFGHIGDAHVHVNILPASRAEFDRGREALLDLARTAVAMGGTVSAEHGLGKRKRALLEIQYGREHLEAMRAVKRYLDPQSIFGRGNIFES